MQTGKFLFFSYAEILPLFPFIIQNSISNSSKYLDIGMKGDVGGE